MKVNQITKINKKGSRYISALLLLHGIRQDEIAKQTGTSRPMVSMVVTRKRGIPNARGPKVLLIRQTIAEKLGMQIEDLWPDKNNK